MSKILYGILCFLLQQAFINRAHPVLEMLDNSIAKKDTIVCCGLDPDRDKMPEEIMNNPCHTDEEKTELFLKTVVDCTADKVCAYKIQKAFFDQFDQGAILLQNVIRYIRVQHPDIPIFLDCKIGDTGNTMQAYLHTFFEKYGVDGILVNPYMGDDIFEALAQYPDKAGIVLVQTSNLGAKIVQEASLENGKPLWRFMLDLVLHRWNKQQNLIPVLSSTSGADNWHEIRKEIPDNVPILFAGVGAQGGDPSSFIQLLNKNNRGVFINSSRELLYPYKPTQLDWRKCIRERTELFREQLNYYRTQASTTKFLLLLGPSGVGKSTIINHLKQLDEKFEYINPYTTRPLRLNEEDKISISAEEISKLQSTNQLLAINVLYGTTYATPRHPIEYALRNNRFPVLDWPISKLDIIKQAFPGKLLCVYIEPPDTETLKQRIGIDQRDKDGSRLKQAIDELALLKQGAFDTAIDIRMINKNEHSAKLAQTIYDTYYK